jgi:hypothetical protein
LDGCLRLVVAAHFHKAEALAAAGPAVLNHLSTGNRAEGSEQVLQIGATDVVAQVPNVQLLTQDQSPLRGAKGVSESQETITAAVRAVP